MPEQIIIGICIYTSNERVMTVSIEQK